MQNLLLNELKLIAKRRGIKGYERMSEDELLSALDASEPVKENFNTDKIPKNKRERH